MGKNKHKNLNLSRADKTILGVIANLNCPIRPFTSLIEKEVAKEHITNMQNVLNGKARRVAVCILDKSVQDQNRIREYADKLTSWANSIYEVPKA